MSWSEKVKRGERGVNPARAWVVALVVALTSLVSFSETVSAQTLTVTTNANDGTGSLREMVAMANDGDRIEFAGSLLGDTIALDSTILVEKDITIAGLSGRSPIVVGPTTGSDVSALQIGAGADVSILDIRVQSNSLGIVALNSGDVIIERTVITSGAGSDTVGIAFSSPGSDLTVIDSTVSGLKASGISVLAADDVVLDKAVVANNSLAGLAASGTVGSVTIQNDSFLSDNGTFGADFVDVTRTVSVTDSSVSDNGEAGLTVRDVVGGAVVIADSFMSSNGGAGVSLTEVAGNVVLTNSVLSFNEELSAGLFAYVRGDLSVAGSQLSNNELVGLMGSVDGDVFLAETTTSSNGFAGVYVTVAATASVQARGLTAASNGNSTSTGIEAYGESSLIETLFRSGVSLPGGSDVAVSDSEFRDNNRNGLMTLNPATSVSVTDVVATGNGESGVAVLGTVGDARVERATAVGNGLGVVVIDVAGSTSVIDTTVTGPSTVGISVGSLSGAERGPVTIDGVSVTGTRTAVAASSGAESLTIVNSTITANAPLPGSTVQAAVIFSDDAPVSLRHSTVVANVSSQLAPLVSTGVSVPVLIDHSIVTDNQTGPIAGILASGLALPLTVSHSVVPAGANLGATNVETNDPLLAALGSNRGNTQTMLPLSGSPAIGAGNAAITGAPATDQRGEPRIVSTIDIGAVETQTADAVTSLAPERFVDTRAVGDTLDDRFQAQGRRDAGSEYRVQMSGRGGVPAGAKAVVINVTAVGAAASGFVTVHPCVSPLPVASSLNYTSGVNLPNEIVAPLTAGGELCLFTSQAIHLLVDVVGFVDARSPLVPVTPSRYLDTRATGTTFDGASLGAGRTGAGTTTAVRVAGRGSVPADAAAVVVNVTAVGAQAAGFVTVHPCLPTAPNASSLNHVAGVNRANELLASVDDSGDICLLTSRSIHLVVDVVGYLPAGSSYQPIAPARFLDTRPTGATVDAVAQRTGKPAAGDQVELQVGGRPGVPANAKAAVINVTAASPETRGFVTVHPCVPSPPNASSLNYVAGVNGANELIASLDADGKVCLFTSQSTHLIVDVVGYLT